MNPLSALSPLDGRYHTKTKALSNFFSESALMKFRLKIEIEWLIFMSEQNILPSPTMTSAEMQALRALFLHFSEEDAKKIKALEGTSNHDVKAIEYFLTPHLPAPLKSFCHFGCTSEDINNLAYALMVQGALNQVMLPALHTLQATLRDQALSSAELPMLARTHGQAATPTTLGKELANFVYRLNRQILRLSQQEIWGKFHGAVGNFNAQSLARPDLNWPELSKTFVESLGLTFNPMVTQIEPHDYLAELSHHFCHINTILIGFTRDLWTYISLGYFKLQTLEAEVGSSTMPHKVNPIDFENAEGNLGLANALFQHFAEKLPISRLQRDLSDSTVMRNMGSAFGYTLLAYQSLLQGCNKITANPAALKADLSPHYEVLTEAIQTLLRYHGEEQAYEKLKAASRGRPFTVSDYHAFVSQLDLPASVQSTLEKLTPETYSGLAAKLAKEGCALPSATPTLQKNKTA